MPSWGVGTGGTRFARFPGKGEPRDILRKAGGLRNCQLPRSLHRLVSLHIPWDRPDDVTAPESCGS